MFMKQYNVHPDELLGNEKEHIYKIFAITDNINSHLLFMKKVLDKGTEKLKTFIISYNKSKLKVHQFEIEEDLQLDNLKDFLKEKKLLNEIIHSTAIELWQDVIYVYNLSKRYSITNRQHHILKEVFVENSFNSFRKQMKLSDDVLNDFVLYIVFNSINKLNFITNIQQLQNLTNSEKNLFMNIENLHDDILFKLNDKIKLTKNEMFVKRIDISPLYLFTDKLKCKQFINNLKLIPYKEETELHFYMNKDFFNDYIKSLGLDINELLINSYRSTFLIKEELRYVAFVESVKKLQNTFRKFDTLKKYHHSLYDKEFNLFKELIHNYQDEMNTFTLNDLFIQIEKNIARMHIDYPTHKLDSWVINKNNYLINDYEIMIIENHKDFSYYVLNHLVLKEKEFIFKDVDVDYLFFSNKKSYFILEIKTTAKNQYKVKHIYSKNKEINTIEKKIIQDFCKQNNIKFKEKEHVFFR